MLATTLIRIPEWGSATILEIIWTLIGATTLAVVTWNFAGAKANLITPVDLEDSYERDAAGVIRRGYLRREAVRFVTALMILSTGITGDVIHSPTSRFTTITGLWLTAAFFIIGLLNVVQSILDQRDRHEVRALLLRSRRASWGGEERRSPPQERGAASQQPL